jgi:hypothetical protein
MSPRRPTLATLALAVSLVALPALAEEKAAPANTGTTKVDVTPLEWLTVGLNVNGLTVDRLKLHPAGKMTSLVLKHDAANRGKVVLTNGTDRRVYPALAMAVFDGEGRLLAAANTGVRQTGLEPGQTKEFEIHFGGVFRHMAEGRTLYVSLEY